MTLQEFLNSLDVKSVLEVVAGSVLPGFELTVAV